MVPVGHTAATGYRGRQIRSRCSIGRGTGGSDRADGVPARRRGAPRVLFPPARRGPGLRDKTALDTGPGRDHPFASDDHAGRARRVLTSQRTTFRPAVGLPLSRSPLPSRSRSLPPETTGDQRCQTTDSEPPRRAGDNEILHGLDLTVAGRDPALMGRTGQEVDPRNAIMGHPRHRGHRGSDSVRRQDITEAAPDERARMGLFMAFQYPSRFPGSASPDLRTRAEPHRAARGEPIPLREFRQTVEAAMKLTNVPKEFSSRTSTTASPVARRSAWRLPAGAPEAVAGDPRRDD